MEGRKDRIRLARFQSLSTDGGNGIYGVSPPSALPPMIRIPWMKKRRSSSLKKMKIRVWRRESEEKERDEGKSPPTLTGATIVIV
jgi:hypothetical protein